MIDLDNEVGGTERALEQWLARQATHGVPELILVSLLRKAADDIEERGYISRQGRQVIRER